MCEILILRVSSLFECFIAKEMPRSKQKFKQQKIGNEITVLKRDARRNRSLSPKSDEEPEWITVSRYGEKDEKNGVSFPIATLIIDWDFESGNLSFPIGFPESKYSIAVNELLIEWEDYQNEVCGYVECLSCEDEILLNQTKRRSSVYWADKKPEYHNLKKDKQILRFVKPPGRKFTHIRIEDRKFYGLELDSSSTRMHEIQCALRSMFDENEVLPIKNAHLTVEIKLDSA